MSVLVCTLQGRTGNQVLQYLFCRAFAEQHDMELRVEPWIGESIFQLSDVRPVPNDAHNERFNEISIFEWARTADKDRCHKIAFRGYAQMQRCMIYTKRDAQSWLKLRPEIEQACAAHRPSGDTIICHHRKGDFPGYGYPVVARESFTHAFVEYGFDLGEATVLSEEKPTPHDGLPDDLSFMPDFYRMMKAPTLLRANSSFSWLAALLGNGLVLSPIIDGLEGGKEHVCRFVPGNWPKFANLSFVEDLHVSPQ